MNKTREEKLHEDKCLIKQNEIRVIENEIY